MLGLGPMELGIILVIIVIIFGVGKLPEIGGALGKGIREFKTESTNEAEDRLDKGTSTTASTLTASARDAREEAPVRERREIRADEI